MVPNRRTKRKAKRGFPIENFGNDGEKSSPSDFRAAFSLPRMYLLLLFVTPAIFKPGSTVFEKMDA